MNRLNEMSAHIRAEMQAGRLTSGRQCRPALRAKWPDVTDQECVKVALLVGAELVAGSNIAPAGNDNY